MGGLARTKWGGPLAPRLEELDDFVDIELFLEKNKKNHISILNFVAVLWLKRPQVARRSWPCIDSNFHTYCFGRSQ